MNEIMSLNSLIYQDPTCFCQVCGFQISEQPVPLNTWEYSMICPCCRMHYGNYDYTEMMAEANRRLGMSKLRLLPTETYQELRAMAWAKWRFEWYSNGPTFWFKDKQPAEWNPQKQLENLGIRAI